MDSELGFGHYLENLSKVMILVSSPSFHMNGVPFYKGKW